MKESEILDESRVFYRLGIGDIQDIARDDFGRALTAEEIEKVEEAFDKFGALDWYSAIWGTLMAIGIESNDDDDDDDDEDEEEDEQYD